MKSSGIFLVAIIVVRSAVALAGNPEFRVHEMGLVPNRWDGGWVVFAADEIQPQKLPDMKTHVSYWKIESPTTKRSSAKP